MRFGFKTAPEDCTWNDILSMWTVGDSIDIYESGWLFDHFYGIYSGAQGDCFEAWTMLAALAQATQRLRLGVMVTGIHYRHPAILANMAATVDIISGGRLEIGVGAGWNMTESDAYGIALGSLKERSDRFEEGIQVLVNLLANDTADFDGQYYKLTNATCNPKPVQRPHPPICVGGSGAKRTLRTTAMYAQHWNFSFGGVDDFKQSRDILHGHCADLGRDPSEILLSSHISYDGNPHSTAATAAEFGEAGVELAIIYLHPPYSPTVLESVAEALAELR